MMYTIDNHKNKDIHFMSVNIGDKSVGKKLLDEGLIATYFHAASNRYGVDQDDPRIWEFHWSVGLTNRYDRVCDLNELPSLSRDILEKMRPYEGMALKLGQRKTNYPITDYETEKRYYLDNLRFWSYILEKHEINAIFFWQLPHHQMEYVIYALAKIKDIPMIVTQYTSIPEVGEYSSSIDTAGENIGDYFERQKAGEVGELSGPVLAFYNEQVKDDRERNRERNSTGFYKKQLKQQMQGIFARGHGSLARERYIKQHIKFIMGPLLNGRTGWIPIDKKDLFVEKQQRMLIRNYLRHCVCRAKEYNKFAQDPDYSKPYIYFGLQLTPELTTMPQAGVFAEQYTTVQMLARAAEKLGIMVYVKEHFVQPFREREVYDRLRSIPNVRLIKSTVSSFDLISHCIAVSTQTGTCILEGAFRGKPALITGEGYNWRGLPGCFLIDSEEQCEQILKDIQSGNVKSITLDMVKRYLYAVQKKTFYVHNYGIFENEELTNRTYESVHRMLSAWIRNGFQLLEIEDCLI